MKGVAMAGGVHTFGQCGKGRLGHGDNADKLEPTAVAALAGEEVAEVAAAYAHTVVRLAGGELRAFGENTYGQLGTGEAAASLVPVAVELPEPEPVA